MSRAEDGPVSGWRHNIRILARLLTQLSPHFSRTVRARLCGVLLLVSFSSALVALIPVAFKRVLDSFAAGTGAAATASLLIVGAYVSSMCVARLLIGLRAWVYARLEWDLYLGVGEQVFDHVMRLPLKFHLEKETGALTQTVMNGLAGCQGVLQHAVFTLLPVIIELALVCLVLINLHQIVYLPLFLAALVSYAVAFAWGMSRTVEPARAATTTYLRSAAVITDSLLNHELVKYFMAESLVRRRFAAAIAEARTAGLTFTAKSIVNGALVAGVFGLFLGVTLLYAAWQVGQGHMSIGGFVLINTYMLQLARPVELLGAAAQQLIEKLAAVEKLLALLTEPAEQRHPAVLPQRRGPASIEFRDVRFAYNPERAVLKGVSFRVPPGKTVALVGASGSGKTSLVRLLFGLHADYSGEILLDDVPITSLPMAAVRGSVAIVPQDTALFNDTIAFNIAVGREDSCSEDIESAARTAALHDFILRLPQGYRTPVGERGVKLSGGEKQRLSIARAVLKRPAIYVFDEATSSLDSKVEQQILRNLRQVSRLSTTLVIAHRLSTITDADEIVVLDDGRAIERGTHDSLLSLRGKYAELWQAQQATFDPLSDGESFHINDLPDCRMQEGAASSAAAVLVVREVDAASGGRQIYHPDPG